MTGEQGAAGHHETRPVRWLRIVTAVLVAVPLGAALLAGTLALVVLDRPAALLVAGVAAVPAVAALVVRGRLLWLAQALPALRDELRAVAAEDRSGADGRPGTDAAQVAQAADDLDRRLRDRLTVRRLWRAARWLGSPTTQAGELAQRNLGPRAAAAVATTTGAADRVVGLLLLTGLSAWGTVALIGTVVALALIGLLG